MEVAVAFGDGDGGVEEAGEGGGGEEIALGAVGGDGAVAEEDDAVDLGDDVGGVVGDEEDGGSLAGELAEEVAEVALGGDVEGVRGFVEEEHLACGFGWGDGGFGGGDGGIGGEDGRVRCGAGAVMELGGGAGAGQGAGDQDAALLAGGHLAHGFVAEILGADLLEEVFSTGAHGAGDVEVGPEGGGGEEAGEDGVETRGVEEGSAGEIGGDDAEALAKFGEIPAPAAEDADGGLRLNERVEFTGDGFEQGGFAAAVGAKDGEVFAGVKGEVDVVEDGGTAARDVDVLEGEDGHAVETG